MHIELLQHETSFGLLKGDIYHAAIEKRSNVLFVHGGGLRGKKGFEAIRTKLAFFGISTYAFDFIGHGDTAGDITLSSLEIRVKQVIEIVNSLDNEKPTTLVASSMGGYIAVKALEFCKVQNLILFAPAVYTKEAYSLPFGDCFSSTIRVPLSWQKTDAWEAIRSFTGSLLLFQAENDQIIPVEVLEKLYNNASDTRSKKLIVFKDATHPLTDWLSTNEVASRSVIEEMVKIIGT